MPDAPPVIPIADRGYARPEVLVSTDWVAEHLDDPAVRLVESNEDLLLYDTGHIPGAVKIDWVNDLNDPLVRDYLGREQLEQLLRRHGVSDMQIFLEGIAVGLFQIFQHESPDPLLRDLIRLVLRDESRHAGFGVMYLHDKFEKATDAEKKRTEEFVGDLLRGFGMMLGGGGMESTFTDIRHRLKQIGLDPR